MYKVTVVFRYDLHSESYMATAYSGREDVFRIHYTKDGKNYISFIPYGAVLSITIEEGPKGVCV